MKKILFILLLISTFASAQVGNAYLTPVYYFRQFGGNPDSLVTNNGAAAQRLINYIAASPSKRGKVIIGPGVWGFTTTAVVPTGVHIWWDGVGSSHDTIISPTTNSQGYGITKLVTASTTIDLFRDSSVGATYSNMDLQNVSPTTPTAGAGINAIGTLFNAHDMTVNGFFYGIQQQNTTDPHIDYVNFRDCVQYGYYSTNAWLSDVGDDAISNCWFRNYYRRTVAQVFKKGSGGMKIVNCKWNAGGQFIGDCIRDSVPSSGFSTGDFMVANCSFENYVGYAINMAVIGAGSVRQNIEIIGGNISSLQGGSGIKMYNSGGTFKHITIVGVTISNCVTGMDLTNLDEIHISGCSNTATTPITKSGCTNYFYDRDVATTAQDGLADKAIVTAFLAGNTVPTINAIFVKDQFNRANTGNIIGSTPSPNSVGNWADVFSPSPVFLGIVSNKLTCASSGTTAVHTATGLSNQDVSVVLSTATITASGAIILLGLYTNSTNWLQLQVGSSGAFNIYTQIAGAFTSIASGTVTLSNNDTLHLRAYNGTAYAIQNSTLIGTGTYNPAVVNGTEAGIYYFNNTATVMDDFTVTSLTGAVTGWQIPHSQDLNGLGTVGSPLLLANPPITGHATLASGTVTITATGATSASTITANVIGPSGGSSTVMLQGTCTTNSCTIQANIAAGTINASDNSTVQYTIFIH